MSPDDGHATGAQVAADGMHCRPATPEEAQAAPTPATDNATATTTSGQVRSVFNFVIFFFKMSLFLHLSVKFYFKYCAKQYVTK